MNWQCKAKQILRLVDREARQWPLYLVDYADVASVDPRLSGGLCGAWTSPVLDVMLRDYLESRGEWVGRGFATILHRDKCYDDTLAIAKVIHEFAHFARFHRPVRRGDDVTAAETRTLLPQCWSDRDSPDDYSPPDPKPWAGHESQFVIAASVLAYRAQCLVPELRPEWISFGRYYYGDAFHETDWMRSLVPMLFAKGPVRALSQLDPPHRFKALYSRATEQESTESETL